MTHLLLPFRLGSLTLASALLAASVPATAETNVLPASVAPATGSTARILPIATDAFAGSSVNMVAGLQHTLFTEGRMQYAAFYSADGTLTLAERVLGQDTWHTQRTPYKGNVADAHNTVAIVVDGEGYLHVAWDHHVNALNYCRSVAPQSLELGPKQPMTGQHEDKVTYPLFQRLPSGDLLCLYRDGTSGRGNWVLNRYDVKTKQWREVHANLIDGENQRSAYLSATIDQEGGLHLAWTWRDTPDVASNHDLCYAKSSDGGETWTTSGGAPLAVPITAATAEYAVRIPAQSSLMNPPSIATDSANRPYLANYWAANGSAVPQYHLVRYDGAAWQVAQVTERTTPFTLAGSATKRPPLSRGALFVRQMRTGVREIYLFYRDDERGGRAVLASCADVENPHWKFRDITADSVGAWEPSLDPMQWARFKQVHFLVQPVEQRDGNDRQAAETPATTIASVIWSPYIASMVATAEAQPAAAPAPAPVAPPAAPPVPASPTAAAATSASPLPSTPTITGTFGPQTGGLRPISYEVVALMQRVADWQLENPSPKNPRGWEKSPFYLGTLELGKISPDTKYREAIREIAEANQWEPAERYYHADDYCVSQVYAELYKFYSDPKMLEPSRRRFDGILAKPPYDVPFSWGHPRVLDRWSWCDALFMGPASWIMVGEAIGDARYRDFANREFWATTESLYNAEDRFFARDESFLDLREPNGRRLYWSRGNGWVVAGLCRTIDALSGDHLDLPRYRQLYRDMMEAVLGAQQPDGLWRPGLLDPVAHPARETSGSAFFTFALAWGINRGLLDRERVEPLVFRAWRALEACVNEDGKLEHVQPVGSSPEGFDPHHTEPFGVGALLLAGSEVFGLVRPVH